MTQDDERAATRVATEAPGADEVAVVAWPLLLKRKVTERVEASDNYPWLVLATVLFGLFSVGFTITILSKSIHRIAEDLGSDVSTLTWVLTGPLLAFAVFGPAAGKIAEARHALGIVFRYCEHFETSAQTLINHTLEEMERDGTYAAIYEKWFGDAIRPFPLEDSETVAATVAGRPPTRSASCAPEGFAS